MKLAAAQMNITWHDRSANHARVRSLAARAKQAGAELLILPEMFSTGFSMDTSLTPEPLDGSTPAFLRSLALEHDMAVVGGFVLARDRDKPQNVSLAVDRRGRDLALYAKIHQIALLEEDKNYGPGDRPMPFRLDNVGITCFVCYDLRFPELFRLVVDQCELFIIIASWPAVRQSHWDVILPARAVENQCFVVGVNRIGQGGDFTFVGGSAIIDPLGNILAHGGEKENLLIADIDPAMVAEVRTKTGFLRDRKPHLLKKLVAGSD